MLNLQSEGHGLKNMGPRLSLLRHTQTLEDQSHGLSMTPVPIKQLKATFMTRVNKKQKAVRDKTGWQSKIQWCKL